MSFDLNAADNLQITVSAIYDSQSIVNVFFYQVKTNGGTVFPVSSSGTGLVAFRTKWEAQMVPLLSNGLTVLGYRMKRIADNGGVPQTKVLYDAVDEIGSTAVGAGGNASLDTFTTINCSLKTNGFGRSARGRKAIGPVPESVTLDTAGNGNILTAAAETDFTDAWVNILPDVTVGAGATGYLLKGNVFSVKKYLSGALFGATIVPITLVNVQTRVGSQTSRKAKNRGA